MSMPIERFDWSSLAKPSGKRDRNVRLLPRVCPADAYLSVDSLGRQGVIISITDDVRDHFQHNRSEVKGLGLDLVDGGGGCQHLVLTLESSSNIDIFRMFCASLMGAIGKAENQVSVVIEALRHVQRWRAFMGARTDRYLTNEEIRGLFAELEFLGECITKLGEKEAAVDAWKGPERSPKDFALPDRMVEVKATSDGAVKISSAEQLDSNDCDTLHLRVAYLEEAPQDSAAQSLNDLVRSLTDIFGATKAGEKFLAKLRLAGYLPVDEYGINRFIIRRIDTFLVNEDFPRISRSNLHPSISHVRYALETGMLAEHRLEEAVP